MQAIFYGVNWKTMIVLDACEAFFLGGSDDLAINDETGSGVVIERGDAENAYH